MSGNAPLTGGLVPLSRELVAQLLAPDARGTGDAPGVLEEALGALVETGETAGEITELEGETLERESLQARADDRKLAAGLKRGHGGGPTSAAGQLHSLGQRPRLPLAAERRLIAAAKNGDQAAKQELVEAFLPLIAGVARVYRGSRTITRTELLQEGVVGLLRALERFDLDAGTPFWGYASWWVRQAMQQLVAELTRPTVLSDRTLRHLSQLKRAHGSYLQAHGREPDSSELAKDSGLTRGQVDELRALDRPARSLEEPVPGMDGEVGMFGELLADPLAQDAYERLLDESEIEQVRALLSSLSERERMVLRARYGLDGPELSLRELGEQIGLSGERVRQIEQRALAKLRAAATTTDDTGTVG